MFLEVFVEAVESRGKLEDGAVVPPGHMDSQDIRTQSRYLSERNLSLKYCLLM